MCHKGNLKMMEKIKQLSYLFLSIVLLLLAYFLPKITEFILATPFVYKPITYNETYVAVEVFERGQKVIVRANVSDDLNDIDQVRINITDPNNVKKVEFELMTDTGESCGTNCTIYEYNYTIQSTDPGGTWEVWVWANDSYDNTASNSTTFKVCVISISLSSVLSNGVNFDGCSPTGEYCYATGNNGDGVTDYNITITAKGCNADLYVKGNQSYLTTDSQQIPISNIEVAYSTTDSTVPTTYDPIGTAFSQGAIGSNLEDGTVVYLKFRLYVPSGQSAGTYNAGLKFQGVQNGYSPVD